MTKAENRIAVVGAGLAGLACSRALDRLGHSVVVYDRGRRPGGRIASRSFDTQTGQRGSFNHGAPCIHVRSAAFEQEVNLWVDAGHAEWWNPQILPDTQNLCPSSKSVVGVPEMASIPMALAVGLNVVSSTTVTSLQPDSDGWLLELQSYNDLIPSQERFGTVVLAMPGTQARRLLDRQDIPQRKSNPVWVCMLLAKAPTKPTALPCHIETPDGDRITVSAKPNNMVSIVAYMSVEWSSNHLDQSADSLLPELLRRTFSITKSELDLHLTTDDVVTSQAHRWGLGLTVGSVQAHTHWWDGKLRLGVCGDGFSGTDAESAWVSGTRLAESVHATI